MVGAAVGWVVGSAVGALVGCTVRALVGMAVSRGACAPVAGWPGAATGGAGVGWLAISVAMLKGVDVGAAVGRVAETTGCDVGLGVGTAVGTGCVHGVGIACMNTPMPPMTTSIPMTSQS